MSLVSAFVFTVAQFTIKVHSFTKHCVVAGATKPATCVFCGCMYLYR